MTSSYEIGREPHLLKSRRRAATLLQRLITYECIWQPPEFEGLLIYKAVFFIENV